MSNITRTLFRAARLSADMKAITSGNPRTIATRGKNKIVGRALGRAGFWNTLWKRL